MKYKNLLLILIIGFGLLVRFYNFEERIVYGPEQAMSLIVSGNYVKERPTLLGQRYFRQTPSGLNLFSGAIFNYSLVPLQFIFRHDILPITAYFGLLNIVTGIIFYFLTKKVLGESIAFFAALIFVFDPLMINHSLFLWNYNYLPLVFLLSLYVLYVFKIKKSLKYVVLLGILSGLGVSLQFLYTIPLIIFLMTVLIISDRKKTKGKDILPLVRKRIGVFFCFTLGAVLGNFPMVLFDLRHDFYHLKSGFSYFYEILLRGGGEGFSYYQFLYVWIIFAVSGGWLLNKLHQKKAVIGLISAAVYIFFSFTSPYINFNKSTGMPDGLTAKDIYTAAAVISVDSSNCKSFNVLQTLDFDTRAHVLRYPLVFKFGKEPLDFLSYKQAECVYMLTYDDYNYQTADFWEINEIKPFSEEKIALIGSGYSVFKLTHNNFKETVGF